MTKVLKEILQNASLGIIVQIYIQSLTILTSAYVAREATQNTEQLGIVNVRLLLLETIILLVSKAAIRQSCLKQVLQHSWEEIMNMLWIMFPLSVAVSIVLSCVWIKLLDQPPSHLLRQYNNAVISTSICCIIEVLGEPPNLAAKAFFFNKFRHALYIMNVSVKTAVFKAVLNNYQTDLIFTFCVGQITSSLFWVVAMYVFFYVYLRTTGQGNLPFNSISQFLPSISDMKVPATLRHQAWSMTGTIFLNHLILESGRYVMTVTHVLSFKEQGLYHLVTSLGSLPSNIILKPLSDNYFMYFSRIFSAQETISVAQLPKKTCNELSKVILYSFRTYIFIGAMITTFGIFFGYEMLHIYRGETVSSEPGIFPLLIGQCVTFIFFAVQVVTDNFSFATLNPTQLHGYNKILVVLLFVQWATAWALSNLFGYIGLTLASCITMAIRIVWGLFHMTNIYRGNTRNSTISGLLPSKELCFILFANMLISFLSKMLLLDYSQWLNLGVVITSFIGSCIAYLLFEKGLLDFLSSIGQNENEVQIHVN